eukprot:6192382-Ditylum_brightwellii.AAC.1
MDVPIGIIQKMIYFNYSIFLLKQEHIEWAGKRYAPYLSTSRKILEFSMDREEGIWSCYKEHDYSMCKNSKAPVI